MRLAPIRTALVITCALLGSAAVLACLVMTTNLLAVHSQSVSDVLPAGDTLLLLTHPQPEDLVLFTQWFPVLQEAPLQEGTEGVAVMRTPEGEQAVVVLLRSNRPLREESDTIALPPFYARVSDTTVIPVLQNRTDTLTRYAPFHALRAATTNGDSWAFATTDALKPTEKTLASAVAQLLMQGATHMGYVRENGGVRLHFYGEQGYRAARHITVQPPADVRMSIALADTNAWWQQLADALPEEQALIFPALLQQWTETTIAPRMSWTYDLLPLLQENGVVLLETNASGALVVALGGYHGSSREAASLAAALQDARRQLLPQYEIRERLFDNRFPSKDIRMRPEEQVATPTEWHQWQIERSPDAGLFTTQHGQAVIVSTDESLLKRAIETLETSSGVPSGIATLGTARTLAAGTLDNGQFRLLLQGSAGWEAGTMPLPLPALENRVRWAVQQRRNIRTLELSSLQP